MQIMGHVIKVKKLYFSSFPFATAWNFECNGRNGSNHFVPLVGALE